MIPVARIAGLLIGFLLLAAGGATAHHSIAPYDLIHGTIIEGVVTRFAWENPHGHIYLDVIGEENLIEHWTIEIDGPGALRRLGWTQNSLKPGDKITVTGARAKNGSFNLKALSVQFPGGRKLLVLPKPEN